MSFTRVKPSVYRFWGGHIINNIPCHVSDWREWGWCSLRELYEVLQEIMSTSRFAFDCYELLSGFGFERDIVKGCYNDGLLLLVMESTTLTPVPFTGIDLVEQLRAQHANIFVPVGWAKEVLHAIVYYKSDGVRITKGRLVAYSQAHGDNFYWGES